MSCNYRWNSAESKLFYSISLLHSNLVAWDNVLWHVVTEYHNGYKTLCYSSWPQESTTAALPSQRRELMLPVQHCLFTIVHGQKGCLEAALPGYRLYSDFLFLVCGDRKTSFLSRSRGGNSAISSDQKWETECLKRKVQMPWLSEQKLAYHRI